MQFDSPPVSHRLQDLPPPPRPSFPDLTTRFVRLCLRATITPAALDLARELAAREPLDWKQVEETARAEMVEPLLYAAVREQQIVPPDLEADLARAYQHSRSRNTFLLGELGAVLAHFAAAEMPVILLKGAGLSRTVYDSAALRPMLDLDLLVRPEHIETAVNIFSANGYTSPRAEPRAGNTLAFESEWLLLRAAPPQIPVELHWSLFDSTYYRFTLPLDWFWDTAVSVKVGSSSALTLGPAAMLMHLCGHLVLHHRRQRLLWMNDIARLLYVFRDRIDWDDLLSRAQRYALLLPLQQVVPQVADEWGAPVPPPILDDLRERQASAAEKRVFGQLTRPRTSGHLFRSDLASLPSFGLKLLFTWNNLFPSRAYMRRRYSIAHDWLLPAYYVYRWIIGIKGALM